MKNMMRLSDLDIATCTVVGEAAAEPWEGKLGVAYVLVNRWRTEKGQFARDDTLATTCLRHLQFSVWTAKDPGFSRLYEYGPKGKIYRESMRALLVAIDGIEPDPTRGALHYHTVASPVWAKSWPPSWASGHEPSATIARHVFYNDVA